MWTLEATISKHELGSGDWVETSREKMANPLQTVEHKQ